MSINNVKKIDQKEYLKKYLSGDKTKKKKKKDRKEKKHIKVKVIDDDLDGIAVAAEIDEELLLTGDDAPQIVGEYIEEQPTRVCKWRSIAVKEEQLSSDETRTNEALPESDLWGQKRSSMKIKDEFSPTRREAAATPESREDMTSDYALRKKNKKLSRSKEGNDSPTEIRKNSIRNLDHIRIKKEKGVSAEREESDLSPLRIKPSQKESTRRHIEQSCDQSPPRKPRHSDRRRDSDQSPPRKRRDSDQSPPRKRRDSDQSPPRKRRDSMQPSSRTQKYRNSLRKRTDSDQSPVRKRRDQSPHRKHTDSDMSPVRKRRDTDQSPPRRRRSNSLDLNSEVLPKVTAKKRERIRSTESSPARDHRTNLKHSSKLRHNDFVPPDQSQSKPRERTRWESNEEPSKQKMNRQSSSDQSPPRRTARTPSPSKRLARKDKERSKTPVRIKQEPLTPDCSPPRRFTQRRDRLSASDRNRHGEILSSPSPPPTHKGSKTIRTLDGKKAGLQDAQALRSENEERRKREERMFAEMDKDVSGRDAEVQVRSTGRRGKRAQNAAAEDPEVAREKEEREKKRKEQYDRWGKGLKQIEEHRKRRDEEAYESSKPLARYADDEDLDQHLRERERLEDPMLEYMRRKKKERQKDEKVATVPVYEGPYPENRFGIRPGHRWDGVDRSNGYEKRWFAVQSEKHARREEAYKYSVEDM